MEEEIKKEEQGEEEEESKETPPETQEESEEESTSKEEDIDYQAELQKLEANKPKSELDKAKRALFFNAERLKELGGDPTEVLGIKKEEKPEGDVRTIVQREFAERDALSRSKSEEEYKLIMWYVDNRNLSVDEAYILANKGKLLRSIDEIKRAQGVQFAKPSNGTKVPIEQVPDRSPEEKKLLERRGLRFNPKTKTWQGKYSEEYFDHESKAWLSRKLK